MWLCWRVMLVGFPSLLRWYRGFGRVGRVKGVVCWGGGLAPRVGSICGVVAVVLVGLGGRLRPGLPPVEGGLSVMVEGVGRGVITSSFVNSYRVLGC